MREDLLHFIWKYKKLQVGQLVTTTKEAVTILDVGSHNHLAGPDFFNAKINIGGQLWAGNVEIHVRSSDWFAHKHQHDAKYNTIILHVVWEHDIAVNRDDHTEIPTLELKNYISNRVLENYRNLFDTTRFSFINCERDLSKIDKFTFQNWSERLFFERLEQKSDIVLNLLDKTRNDWEHVLFMILLKSFGLKINGEAFYSLGRALDFSIVRKMQQEVLQLESVFMGLSHLLENEAISDDYHSTLKKEYRHLKAKYELSDIGVRKPEFFKLRPSNFPTLRLSQLANLYATRPNLFSNVIETRELSELYSVFETRASTYWENHFTFGKLARKSSKKVTKKFIDLVILNALLPVKYCYARQRGKDVNEEILEIASKIIKEENSIITNFESLGITHGNARETQATLQLYKGYCSQNKCLQCAIGNSLLSENS